MTLPDIVTEQEWEEARRGLLLEEKEMTKARDRLNTQRRELPMVEVTKDYAFDGETALVCGPRRASFPISLAMV